jgi:hypothetical protein
MGELVFHIPVGILIGIVQPQVLEDSQQYQAEYHQEPGQRSIDLITHRQQK